MDIIESPFGKLEKLGKFGLAVECFLSIASRAWQEGGREAAVSKLQEQTIFWNKTKYDDKKLAIQIASDWMCNGELDAPDVRLRLNLLSGWDDYVQMNDPSSGDFRIPLGEYRRKRAEILDATPEQLESIRQQMWVWPNLRESTS